MKLIIFYKSNIGGCDFYRLIQPYEAIKNMYNIELDSYIINDIIDFDIKASHYDFYIFHKNNLSIELIRALKQQNKKVIIDFDDSIELPETHILYGKSVDEWVEALEIADYITVTTSYLKRSLLKYNIKYPIEIFPNVIPNTNSHPKFDTLKIGYLGGNTHKYDIKKCLNGLNSILRKELKNKYELIIFGVTGYIERTVVKYLSSNFKHLDNMKFVGPVPMNEFLNLYKYINVSLAPLEDNEFNRCKSELKFVEAAAYNIPLIASNVEPYKIIKSGESGFLCNNRDDFVDVIKLLDFNKDLTRKVGINANKVLSLQYNYNEIIQNRFNWLKSINDGEKNT